MKKQGKKAKTKKSKAGTTAQEKIADAGMETEKEIVPQKTEAKESPDEEKKQAEKSFFQSTKSVPMYAIVLAIIAALVVGYAASVFFSPAKEFRIDDLRKGNNGEKPKPEINTILVYSEECGVCEQNHSFLPILSENNYSVLLATLSDKSPEGARIMLDFNIAQLPVLLIPKASITKEMKVKNTGGEILLEDALGLIATEQLGFFVVEEQNFDGKSHTVELVQTSCSKPDLVTVDLFEDPYSPNTIRFKQPTIEARKRFDENVGFNYNLHPTTTASFPPILKENADYLGRTMVCAADTGSFNELEKEFYLEYCGITDSNNLDAAAFEKCAAGATGLPLTQEKTKELVGKTGVPEEAIDLCLRIRANDYIVSSKAKAELFYVTNTPTAIVDCKYKTHPRFLGQVICFAKPDLKGCRQQ